MLSLNAELNQLAADSKQSPYQRVLKILYDVGETVAQAQLMLSSLDARVTLYSADTRIPETYWNFLRLERLETASPYQRFLQQGANRGWGGIGPVYPPETTLRTAGNQQMLCYYQKLLTGLSTCAGVIQCGVAPQKMKEAGRQVLAGRRTGQIARDLGYQSPQNFNRTFVRYYQCTPGEYRRKDINKEKA